MWGGNFAVLRKMMKYWNGITEVGLDTFDEMRADPQNAQALEAGGARCRG